MQPDNQNPQPGQPTDSAPQPTPFSPAQSVAPQTVFNPTSGDQQLPAEPLTPSPAAAAPAAPSPSAFGAPQAPGVIGGFAAPAAPTAPTSPFAGGVAPGAMGTHKKRKLPMLAVIIGSALLVAAAGFFVFRMLTQSITLEDVNTARDASSTLSNDVSDASIAMIGIDSVETSDELTSKINLINTKMADADKQYKALKDSAVLHDSKVKAKFEAFEKKWAPYKTYVQQNIGDMKALQPMTIKLEKDIDELTKDTPSSTGEMGAYLASFKSIVDEAASSTAKLKMTVPENQKMVEAFQKFLNESSKAIAAAQTDLAAGKNIYTVVNHMYDISDAQSNLNDSIYSLENQIRDKGKQLDPSNEFNSFQSALSSLYLTVK